MYQYFFGKKEAMILSSLCSLTNDPFGKYAFNLMKRLGTINPVIDKMLPKYSDSRRIVRNTSREKAIVRSMIPTFNTYVRRVRKESDRTLRILDFGGKDRKIADILEEQFDCEVTMVDKVNDVKSSYIVGLYDIVIMRQTLHHMSYSQQNSNLQICSSHLIKDGIFWITDHDIVNFEDHLCAEMNHFMFASKEHENYSDIASDLYNCYINRKVLTKVFSEWKQLLMSNPKFEARVFDCAFQKTSESIKVLDPEDCCELSSTETRKDVLLNPQNYDTAVVLYVLNLTQVTSPLSPIWSPDDQVLFKEICLNYSN